MLVYIALIRMLLLTLKIELRGVELGNKNLRGGRGVGEGRECRLPVAKHRVLFCNISILLSNLLLFYLFVCVYVMSSRR